MPARQVFSQDYASRVTSKKPDELPGWLRDTLHRRVRAVDYRFVF
jgi:hypothetical protein